MPDTLCKVCGLTRREDALLCHELGVDFTGFIFAAQSPRRVPPAFVASLPDAPGKSGRRVGVFAGMDLDSVLRTAEYARLDYIQLHGGENPSFCRAVGPERVIKALWPDALSRKELEAEMTRFAPVAAYFLLDAGKSGGGSGSPLAWAALQGLVSPRPWLLAGGLGPENLHKALSACTPDGVDLNSALEIRPGVKDHQRVREALRRLRALS